MQYWSHGAIFACVLALLPTGVEAAIFAGLVYPVGNLEDNRGNAGIGTSAEVAANTSQSTTTSFARVCAPQLANKVSSTPTGRFQIVGIAHP